MSDLPLAPYLKDIGRGKEGARALDAEAAEAVFAAVLDGRVGPVELGAFVMAMRIKGESQDELAGFLQAVQARCLRLEPARPTVVLPSYNGSRKLPNLTALLALLLAQDGVQVLVHGPTSDPARVTTAEIFHALGLPVAGDVGDILDGWRRHEPVFVPTDALCPPLARLLALRWTVGLRNSGHTVAKLLDPCAGGRSIRVVNYTHPEYGSALQSFLGATGANAMLLRGTEGEPAADPRRQPRMEVFLGGRLRPELGCAAQEGVLAELPVLPRDTDAATTALYIQSVVSGEKPAPAPLQQQVAALRRALEALQAGPAAPAARAGAG
ncbi:DNA-binding protein YbiB [Piscinibacter sakaiensis]|uniref:Anthranilate phosphoribosyltransferase like n=1 Tax=Piscinibacter sakaiensis TaxID=1547922 RepID=A0A0K8NWF4_PISS1|nr:anthranilate phosphoribosyltransferase like [Piscinibacter sakaiensis]